MITRKMLLIGTFLTAVPLLTNAQATLSGKITNSSNEAIPGVRILITNTFQGAITKPDGTFNFSGIKAGTYFLEISALGYAVEKDTVQLVNGPNTQNYMLHEVSYQLEGIVVYGLRAGEKTPTTYTNLSSQKIEKLNYGQDLPYLFNLTPS